MNLDDFKSALDDQGIKYRESGVSLAVQECPACGSTNFKVLFRVYGVNESDPFFGRCQRGRCEEGYSSIKYLTMMGMERADVLRAHGLDAQKNFESLIPNIIEEKPKEKKQEYIIVEPDVKKFIKISAWPDHPASKYAINRGVKECWFNDIMIDPVSNAVVFLVKDGDKVIGYQKRFVNPPSKNFKTQTSVGFTRSNHVLRFERKGNIVVCEGPFTALSAWEFGFDGICTLGSGMSEKQMDIIAEIAEKEGKSIGFACENDTAGRKSLNKFRNYMIWKKIKVFKVLPECGKDLNDSYTAGRGFIIDNSDNWSHGIPEINLFGV